MVTKAERRSRSRRAPKPSKQIWVFALVGAFILLAVWIGWNTIDGIDTPDEVQRSGVIGSQVGDLAPDFTVFTLDGQEFNLANQRGKPAILFAMAYWCGTCIPEARALAQLHEEYAGQLSILALDLDPSSTAEALAQFKTAANDPDYTWAFDTAGEVTRTYQITALDTTLVIDADGFIIYRDTYPTPYKNLKEVVSEILP